MTITLHRSSVHSSPIRSSRPLGAILVSAILIAGCSKKEDSASSTSPKTSQLTAGATIELVSHAPEQSFLLVVYDGESEGGKRSYAESLKTVRRFISSETTPGRNGNAAESSKAATKTASSSPRSLETIQQELAEMLESSGFLPHEPGSTPPYREVVLFAAAGNDNDLVNGGLCASGPDFSKKLDTLITAMRSQGYEIVEQPFGATKGYAVSIEVAEPREKNAEPDQLSTSGDAESNDEDVSVGKTEATGDASSVEKSPESRKVTVYLGSSPDGIIGVGSNSSAVTQCLHPEKKALPPIVTSPTIKRIVERHPDTEDDFLRMYFDLDLFKRALESKRDSLEKLLGETDNKAGAKAKATPCGPEEACQPPTGTDIVSPGTPAVSQDVASNLPSLQDSINKIGQLPSRTFLAKGSFDAKNAVTMRLVTLLEKEHPHAASIYKGLEESSFPRALASIPGDAAILLGVHYPVEKALPLLPLIENSPYAPVKTIRSVALSILGLPAGSLAPELGMVIESNEPAQLAKLLKTAVTPLLERGGLPVSSWQNKQVDGVPTSFILSPFGIGLFVSEPSGALVVSTTEGGIARLIATHKNASPERTAEALLVSPGTHAPLAGRIDAVQLAKMLRGLQSTVSMMMPKEAGSLDSAKIEQLQALGTMYFDLEFDNGFTELVWRKVPLPTERKEPQS